MYITFDKFKVKVYAKHRSSSQTSHALLFVHGLSHCAEDQTLFLSKIHDKTDLNIYAYDLIGHGLTNGTRNSMDIEAQSEAFTKVLAHVSQKHATIDIVAHSFGALVTCYSIGGKQPTQLRNIILLAPFFSVQEENIPVPLSTSLFDAVPSTLAQTIQRWWSYGFNSNLKLGDLLLESHIQPHLLYDHEELDFKERSRTWRYENGNAIYIPLRFAMTLLLGINLVDLQRVKHLGTITVFTMSDDALVNNSYITKVCLKNQIRCDTALGSHSLIATSHVQIESVVVDKLNSLAQKISSVIKGH